MVYLWFMDGLLVDSSTTIQSHSWWDPHTSAHQGPHLQMEQWQMDTAAGSPVALVITASAGMGRAQHVEVPRHITYMGSKFKQMYGILCIDRSIDR